MRPAPPATELSRDRRRLRQLRPDRRRRRERPGLCASPRIAPADALPVLVEAVPHLARDCGARHDTARVRVLLARAYRALGDIDSAARELDTADADVRRAGRGPDRAVVAALRGSRDAATRWDCTAREIEVLTCLAAGRTNREIAAALVISEKTVGRHLSHMFTKLRMTSRTAAAAAYAHEHGLVGRTPQPATARRMDRPPDEAGAAARRSVASSDRPGHVEGAMTTMPAPEAPLDPQASSGSPAPADDVHRGITTLMIDLADRTGLLDALATGPGTSTELAARTGLTERYVRECLAALATPDRRLRRPGRSVHPAGRARRVPDRTGVGEPRTDRQARPPCWPRTSPGWRGRSARAAACRTRRSGPSSPR